jgi:hypothetical protein
MPNYQVKISAKSHHHAHHNLSSNATAKVSEIDNKQVEKTPLQSRIHSFEE